MSEAPAWKNRKLHIDLLGVILLLALFLRLNNLGTVQRWTGDQSSFYNIIMNWAQDGKWPLLGPWRSISGDFGIGPGWYYTIAPALLLTGYHLAAGAATVALFGVATIALYFVWVRRTSGSTAAALATAAVFAFAAGWVGTDRTLWNPHVMPFSVIAMALIIDGIERKPVRYTALFLMLLGILPHWHSAGIPVAAAALPPAAVALARGRGRWREAGWREWAGWGLALAAVLLALYIPPVIHELKPGPGNMRNYLKNTLIPTPPVASAAGVAKAAEDAKKAAAQPLLAALPHATARMVNLVVGQTFFSPLRKAQEAPSWFAAVAAAALFLLVGLRVLALNWRTVPLSLFFLVFILGGHWLMLVLKGAAIMDYFVLPAMAAPVLLTAWTAGRLLTDPGALPGLGRGAARATGTFIVAAGLTLTAMQAPAAWRIQQGKVSYGSALLESRIICEHIVRDAGKMKVGMLFTDAAQNSPYYMHVMLRTMGLRTVNGNYSLRRPSARHILGERLYLIARGDLNEKPTFEGGPAFPLEPPVRVFDAWIYRIPTEKLPPEVRTVYLRSAAPRWYLILGKE